MKNDKPGDHKARTYSVPQAGQMAGLSRNSSYAAAERGEIPTISFGRLLRVPAAAWDRILQEGSQLCRRIPLWGRASPLFGRLFLRCHGSSWQKQLS